MVLFRLSLQLWRFVISQALWQPDSESLTFIGFTAIDIRVLSMALAFGDHATADGVAKNLPVFGYTTVAVLDPAAHRAGVVPSRGAHDSCSLACVNRLLAIGFNFLNSSALEYTFGFADLPLFDCSNIP